MSGAMQSLSWRQEAWSSDKEIQLEQELGSRSLLNAPSTRSHFSPLGIFLAP